MDRDGTPGRVYSRFVGRNVVLVLVLAVATAAGAVAYTVSATQSEYARLIAAGDAALSAEAPFQALEAYSGAIALRPESMVAHLKRGMTYRHRGELDAALKDLRRASELDPTATLPLDLLGDTYLALGRFERAAARYQTFVTLDDRSARVWYKLGLAHYRAGQLASAQEPLQRAVALDKSLAEAHLLLGLCLRDQGHLAGARASLQTATRLAPGLTAPREALAGLYATSGEPSRAIDQLEALAVLDPNRPQRFVALGLAHARARRHEAAVVTLSRAVERFPDDPHVYAALGRVWLESAETSGDGVALRKAVEALTIAASHADATGDTLTDLGRALLAGGDLMAAERTLRQAATRLPVRPEVHRYLATLAARNGRVQDARDALIRYATLVGDTEPLAGVAAEIARYCVRLGDRRLALRWIDRAIDEAGSTPALLALRRRAEATGMVVEARP